MKEDDELICERCFCIADEDNAIDVNCHICDECVKDLAFLEGNNGD